MLNRKIRGKQSPSNRQHRGRKTRTQSKFLSRLGILTLIVLCMSTMVGMTVATSNADEEIIDEISADTTAELVIDDTNYQVAQISRMVNIETEATEVEITTTVTSEEVPELEEEVDLESLLGDDIISIDGSTLTRYDLPNVYYPNIDHSSFQAWMPYKSVNDVTSESYKVVHSENTYVDEVGLLRYKTTADQFTIDGADDYVVALGTYYKEKGTCGSRYLVVTENGMYTAIAGDEKDDRHTDKYNMFAYHNGGVAGVIEWIVDPNKLDPDIKTIGSVTAGPVDVINGEILYIYMID